MERMEQNDIIIYNTDDGKSSVVLVGADGMVWLNQLQMAELLPPPSSLSVIILPIY